MSDRGPETSCQNVERLITEKTERQLRENEAANVRLHLQTCASCRAFLHTHDEVLDLFINDYAPAPESLISADFTDRIMARLARAQGQAAPLVSETPVSAGFPRRRQKSPKKSASAFPNDSCQRFPKVQRFLRLPRLQSRPHRRCPCPEKLRLSIRTTTPRSNSRRPDRKSRPSRWSVRARPRQHCSVLSSGRPCSWPHPC